MGSCSTVLGSRKEDLRPESSASSRPQSQSVSVSVMLIQEILSSDFKRIRKSFHYFIDPPLILNHTNLCALRPAEVHEFIITSCTLLHRYISLLPRRQRTKTSVAGSPGTLLHSSFATARVVFAHFFLSVPFRKKVQKNVTTGLRKNVAGFQNVPKSRKKPAFLVFSY